MRYQRIKNRFQWYGATLYWGQFYGTMWQNCCITCNRWHGRIIVCGWSTLEYQPLIYRPGSAWFFIIAKTPRLPAEHLPSSSSVNAMRARCIGSLSFFFFLLGGLCEFGWHGSVDCGTQDALMRGKIKSRKFILTLVI